MLIVIVTVGMENKMPQTMENCLPRFLENKMPQFMENYLPFTIPFQIQYSFIYSPKYGNARPMYECLVLTIPLLISLSR